ncbi:thiamine transport system substrate-binding protein [Isoptericola sp. CG 20/1183]|uniref:Thiamine transport system substrate-binding protein n=1 Tax=Isoptericola halotolerans TaxID=300560 RepID=A0ABX5E9R7_9MICO|nr:MULTISPECIES: thiamine ABC transporter substrate-binding protein [Isoptericola]PRZ03093.1 thiamine transport system substrate-binding protein [Isoptericola sp. CG 20/1183]PRZ03347.1 thiamine transport system substrate-binding protein [Isoptericola halotolerans]
MTIRTRRTLAALAVVGLVPALAACSGDDAPGEAGSTPVPAESSTGGELSGTVTLVTHDSFALSDGLLESFEEGSGLEVEHVAAGDAGALVNQLVLTQDSPLGDVVYGVDNTFASRAVEAGVFEPYTPADLDPSVGTPVEEGLEGLTPIDRGDVCLNVDTAWFEEEGIEPPSTFEDLTQETYADLTVVTNPATSSPGFAFLLATISAFGEDGWQDYWAELADNGLRVTDGWSDAYYVDFSGAGEGGERPVVLSYATSPAFTVTEDGSATTTAALLDTCFRQVEYAGVLAGTDNPAGARALVDFLASEQVQADIPASMYMYPADESVELPAEWEEFAPLAEDPYEVSAQEIAEHRDEWIQQWTATVIG